MDNDSRPIRLVTFDLYDTLIELVPTRWARLSQVLSQRGLEQRKYGAIFEPIGCTYSRYRRQYGATARCRS